MVPGLALCLIAGAPATAQTLREALTSTYTTNPTLRAARAELRAVNEEVPQALANWRPVISLSGAYGAQRTESQITSGTTTPFEATARVTQPLYRGGRTIAGTQRAESRVQAQRSILRSVEQSVLLRAATAHMGLWRDQAVVGLNRKNEAVLRRQLEASQDRFAVGEITRTDVAQSETRLAVAIADRVAAEGTLAASRAVFEEVVGIAPGAVRAAAPPEGLPAILEEAVSLAKAVNPDVMAANFAEVAARRQVREVAGELWPTVSLEAKLSHSEEASFSNSESDQAQILAQVTVPLYQQGAVSSRIRQAKQISSQRRLEIEEARRRAEQEAIGAWQGLQTARAQIRSFESGVRAAEIALEGVRQENAVGARTVLDLLDAEQELLDSQVNLVRARRDEVVAGFQLSSAVGRLSARELGLSVEIYDPEIDYLKVRDRWFMLE
ncbi:MAG: TolC family outer membrane protein, partial [Kiloniellales bacterium]